MLSWMKCWRESDTETLLVFLQRMSPVSNNYMIPGSTYYATFNNVIPLSLKQYIPSLFWGWIISVFHSFEIFPHSIFHSNYQEIKSVPEGMSTVFNNSKMVLSALYKPQPFVLQSERKCVDLVPLEHSLVPGNILSIETVFLAFINILSFLLLHALIWGQ